MAAEGCEDVRKQISLVRGVLVRKLGRRADLDDLVQVVFLEFHRALPRFRGESKLSTYLAGFAVRVARRARRPARWDLLRSAQDLDDDRRGSFADQGPDPEEAAAAREAVRRVQRALGKISSRKRRAFWMWAVEGRTPEEISSMTRASCPAVRSQIYFARREIAKKARRDPYLSDYVRALEA
jgi:RNA polymerase sigma-70 factor (ECF subfamily)